MQTCKRRQTLLEKAQGQQVWKYANVCVWCVLDVCKLGVCQGVCPSITSTAQVQLRHVHSHHIYTHTTITYIDGGKMEDCPERKEGSDKDAPQALPAATFDKVSPVFACFPFAGLCVCVFVCVCV